MTSLYIYRHAGSMPCPVCGKVEPHAHDMTDAELSALSRDHRIMPFEPSPFAIEAMAERQRQIDHEGFTVPKDQVYTKAELIRAAICFAFYALSGSSVGLAFNLEPAEASQVGRLWPWPWLWFKPESRRRALVKATALLIAEGDRQDYAERMAAEKAERELKEKGG